MIAVANNYYWKMFVIKWRNNAWTDFDELVMKLP